MKKLVYSVLTAVAILAFAAPAFAEGGCSGAYTVSVPDPVTTADADTSPPLIQTQSGG
ncbi:MAG: hypothetical protein IH906_00525 [Proteobacteria bacterium]|nr:hypothetical protein [Pseudomonadota bacterium]